MKILTAAFFVILLASCKTKPSLVAAIESIDTLHLPKDSLSFYFPPNTVSTNPSSDSFVQNWYSSALYSFKEPLLSKAFVGHDIYRFLWLRSFDQPVVFSLHQNNGQVWLNTKMLDDQPRFRDERISGIPKEEQAAYIKDGYFFEKKDPRIMARIADRKANIIYNKNIILSEKEWDELELLLAKAHFWTLPSNIDDQSTDGAQWIIEAHLKNRYHVVDYHSPYDEFKNAGLFFIKLSGLKEEVY